MTSVASVGPAEGAGKVVLVVEDVAVLRRVVARQMTQLGYSVREASDFETAVDVLEHEPIDVLFTDIMLGRRGTGTELARLARGRWPALRVVFTSGFPDSKIRDAAAGVTSRILGKPFRSEELAQALRDVMHEAP